MSLPYTAAWDEDEDDTVEGDFGPYLSNLRGEPPKPKQSKSVVPVYDRGLCTKPKRPATAKQIKFATAISRRLDIKLPDERTRQSLFLFIRDNKPKFDEASKKLKDMRKFSGNYVDDPDPIDPDEDALMMEAYGLDPYTGGFADNY